MRRRTIVIFGLLLLAGWLGASLLSSAAEPVASRSTATEAEPSKSILQLFRPPRTAGLSGTVMTAAGEPVSKARVCATCANCEITGSQDQVCGETQEGGRYLLAGLGPSGYRVTAVAKGYAITAANDGQLVYLPPGASRDDLDIVLSEPGALVGGRVLDATGGPIAAARVRLVTWLPLPVVTEVETDLEGAFVGSVAAGRVTVIASAAGYGSARVARVAPTADVTVVLTPGGTLAGKVLTLSEQRPVAGAVVSALTENRGASGMWQAVSGPDGSFEIHGLEPARYVAVASAPGYRGSEQRTVELGLGESVTDLRVLVVPATQVRGRVVIGEGPDERPCEQGFVMLGPPHPQLSLRSPKWTQEALDEVPPSPTTVTAAIGAQGVVQFDAVVPGSYFASVSCQAHLQSAGPDVLHVGRIDIEDLLWRVTPAPRLSVRVVDGQDRPLPWAEVELRWPDTPSQGGARDTVRADAEGRTPTFSHLYPGVYVATLTGSYRSEPTEIELSPARSEVEAVLRAEGSAVLEVVVRDHVETPVDGLRVAAQPCEEAESTEVDDAGAEVRPGQAPVAPPGLLFATGANFSAAALGEGRYRIAPLPAGCYRVAARDGISPLVHGTDADGANELELTEGEVRKVTVTLPRGASIDGVVLGADGGPLQDVWVSAQPSAGAAVHPMELAMQRGLQLAFNRVLSDYEGRFRIEQLDPNATYDLRAEEPAGASSLLSGVKAGEPVTVSMPAAGAIEGIVTGPDGRAVDDFVLRVTEARTQRTESREFIGAEGRFSLRGITPGMLEIQAIEPSGQVAMLEAELAAGQELQGLRLSLPR